MRWNATLYWAERGTHPSRGYTPVVKGADGFGRVHGFVVCIGNFDNVDAKRRSDYEFESVKNGRNSLIWC